MQKTSLFISTEGRFSFAVVRRKLRQFQMIMEGFVTRLKDKIQYFEDNSTLQRFGHVISTAKPHIVKRLFWLVFLSACCAGAAAVLKGSLSLYAQDAVSYSVETDFLEWDTPFPAVTICQAFSTEKSTKKALVKKDLSPALYNFAKAVMYWNRGCKICLNCKINKTCVNEVSSLVETLKETCEGLLTECWWNDEEFSCCDRFLPIKTQYGTCFIFNSRQLGTEDIEVVNMQTGLPVLTFTAIDYITVKVHSPDEIITMVSDNNLGSCGGLPIVSDFEVILSAEQTVSDISVRGIAQGSRDCLFLDERPATSDPWPFPRYSLSACVWYCKAEILVELCNCTHHFMPRVENRPVCDVQGLVCIYRNINVLESSECSCPMDCEEMTYKVVHVSCNRLEGLEVHDRGTQGSVRLAHLPSLRVRRHAIRDMLGLVVDFGGVIGVFFGASILSFIEVIYIFCMRRSR